MDITLEDFRNNAESHGICEMSKDWDGCKSKKQLIDLALSIRGIEYIATAIGEGWGISPKQICKEFEPFNNGRYVRDKDGYTSALYCSDGSDITANVTALLVIDFDGSIFVPKNYICEIHAVNSKFKVLGEGTVNLYRYGNTEVVNTADTQTEILELK